MLPGSCDAVAAWLTAHPEITTISRDRYGPYAEGVRRGAPQATQVADRFHLVVNLQGAVEREFSRLRACLTVPHVSPPVPANANHHPISGHRRRRSTVVTHQRRIAQERRVVQLERFALVKRLQAAGRPSCARRGIGRASVRKWIRLTELPIRHRMGTATRACRTSTASIRSAAGRKAVRAARC